MIVRVCCILIFSFFISCSSLANQKPTRDDFMRDAMERYGPKKINNEILDNLRKGAFDANQKTPINYGNDVFLTSTSIADSGLMTFRFLMKSSTRFQINPELVSNELITLVCTTNSLYSGIYAGVTAKVLLTTVDGFDVDSGVISKSTCSKFR